MLTAVTAAAFVFGPDVEDALLGDGLSRSALSAGDIVAALLWATSLWFVSPLQLLLLFLGKIETERPSDWLMNAVGAAQGEPVTALGYEHPVSVKVLAGAATAAAGCGSAYALSAGLGDATWAVSSGIATCMAAGVYELGRPTRMSAAAARQLEDQWQVFGAPPHACSCGTHAPARCSYCVPDVPFPSPAGLEESETAGGMVCGVSDGAMITSIGSQTELLPAQ